LQVFSPPIPSQKPQPPPVITNYYPPCQDDNNTNTNTNPNNKMQYPLMYNPYLIAGYGYPGMPISGTAAPGFATPYVKQYNVVVNGPNDPHDKFSLIYEDTLPTKKNVNTSSTIGERIAMSEFIYSAYIRKYNGEDIDLNGFGENSLYRFLKFLDINPYDCKKHLTGPYKNLPSNVLFYSACYPIKYDNATNSIQCAPNSIGVLVRIYKMSEDEYIGKNNIEHNLWREVGFYEYIRENVIKKKVSPNFPLLYCYYISQNCNINFQKLELVKGNINKVNMNLPVFNKDCTTATVYKKVPQRALVALTEAPTYSLCGWATKTYTQVYLSNVRQNINPGYHRAEVWMSVLFQLIDALSVMQKYKIAFTNFTMEDNVYIKDLNENENITLYWKYKISGYDYYVPNYGYLVMIDSNYKDKCYDPNYNSVLNNLNNPNVNSNLNANHLPSQIPIFDNTINNINAMANPDNANTNPKIIAEIFHNHDAEQKAFCQFKECFNPNTWSLSFTNVGGTKPPETIMNLINRIYDEINKPNSSRIIEDYIHKFFGSMLNNRIGTILTKQEYDNVRQEEAKVFDKGQIVVEEFQPNTYKFVLFEKEENNNAYIITREDPLKDDFINKIVPISSLVNYSKWDTIVQNYKPSERILSDNDLIEVYVQ